MTLKPKMAAKPAAPIRGLSQQERSVLTLVAEGKRNKDICRELGVSIGELQHALQSSIQSLGAQNLMHAVSLAILLGHIAPNSTDQSE